MKDAIKTILGLIAVLYLMNLTAGIIEVVPDVVPLIGNIDEGLAAIIAYQAFVGKQLL